MSDHSVTPSVIMRVTHCSEETASQLKVLVDGAYRDGRAGRPLRTRGAFLPSRSSALVEKAYNKGVADSGRSGS